MKRLSADPGTQPTPEVGTDTAATRGYIHRKDEHLKRLKRIEGQARGLQRMVEEEQDCIDILTQVAAMTKALQTSALRLLDDHLRHCVMHAAETGGEVPDERLREASQAIERLMRV